MKTKTFDPSDLISILNSLATYKQACVSNEIHESATMWCVKCLTKKSNATSLVSHLYSKNEKSPD